MIGSLRTLLCTLVLLTPALAFPLVIKADSVPPGQSSLAYYDEGQLVQPKTDAYGDPLLPDFAYAGYRFGEEAIPDVEGPVFDVTEFGAVPDNNEDDTEAIQKAIHAAEQAGGGVVFFPPGVFHLATPLEGNSGLVIESSNIVLRGSGSTAGGTILHKVNPMSKEYLIEVRSPKKGRGESLTGIEGVIPRNTRTFTVEDASKLSAGQWVVIYVNHPSEVVPYFMDGYEVEEGWSRIRENGVPLKEIHQIESVDGNQVRLKAPVMTRFRESYGPALAAFNPIEETGVEDLTIMGNWIGHFIHHRGDMDDYYFNAIRFNRVVNSWVRRCTFINLNEGVRMVSTANLTYKHTRLVGTGGHGANAQEASARNLVALSVDDSDGYWHNPGWRDHTAGAVFWRYDIHKTMPISAAGETPYSSLLDAISGGYLMDSAGGSSAFPQHGPGMVIWNFDYMPGASPDQIGIKDFRINFWDYRPFFVKPIVVGLHGAAEEIGLVEESMLIVESLGTPVEPESLYEAQLKDRFGELPQWTIDARTFWEEFRSAPYPEHFHPMREGNTTLHHFPQDIPLAFLAERLKGINQVRRQPSDFEVMLQSKGSFRSDYMKVKIAVNNVLSYLHSFSVPFGEWHLYADRLEERGSLELEVVETDGKRVLRMDAELGIEEPEGYYDLFPREISAYQKYLGDNKAQEWDGAVEIVRALGGRIEKFNVDGGSRVRIEIPEMQ